MSKQTIRDINFAGKKALVRVDFNVPLKEGVVNDDTRIRAAIPTLKYLLDQGAALILMSHLGRPKGEAKAEFSLEPVVSVLSDLLGKPVQFASDCIGEEAASKAAALNAGDVLLLQNTRYYAGEKKNDPELAQKLAKLGDVFVNDAFGTAHRAHASTVGVADYLPAVSGLLLERELDYLIGAVSTPKRPFVAILGGAKVSDKIGVIENLLTKADKVLIGGGMANTFYKAQGLAIGNSLVEDDVLDTAKSLLAAADGKLVLPSQVVIADAFSADANTQTIAVADGVPDGWMILDVVTDEFSAVLADAKLVVWNGPMGVFELAPFAIGTNSVAQMIADSDATSIVGGGDSVSAIKKSGLASEITHISTGGGASLELLEGKELPGVAAIGDKMAIQRTPIIAGNWKMNMSPAAGVGLAQGIVDQLGGSIPTQVVVCPPAVSLFAVSRVVGPSPALIGAQNIYFESKGAYTGEIAPDMLTGWVNYVIIGHSERRQMFGDTNEWVNKKVKAAFAAGLMPILCCGETLAQREAGETNAVLKAQIESALDGVSADDFETMVIAYEPIWAIGTGVTATPEQAEETCAEVRCMVAGIYGDTLAEKVRIQYGGSVKPANAFALASKPNIDGFLVGGASLKADSFVEIIREAARAYG